MEKSRVDGRRVTASARSGYNTVYGRKRPCRRKVEDHAAKNAQDLQEDVGNEAPTEPAIEVATEAHTAFATEAPTEPTTKVATEAPTEFDTEALTEAAIEAETEAPPKATQKPTTEADIETDTEAADADLPLPPEEEGEAEAEDFPFAVEEEEEATSDNVSSSTQRQSRQGKKRGDLFVPCLKHAVEGGPQIPELLISFEGHVADDIRMKKERKPLVIQHRRSQLRDWTLCDAEWCGIVRRSGLVRLQGAMYKHINAPLISAFVERWHPETNSFHMPWGEMTITLHDVYYILGLQISGDAVVRRGEPIDRETEVLEFADALQIEYDLLIQDEVKRRGIKYSDLKKHYDSGKIDGRPHLMASAFLMYLIGSTIFTDKSQHRLPVPYFSVVRDHEAVETMSWGSGALAYMYRQLGKASRKDCKQIAGCVTLLESWIYHYFPQFRPVASSRRISLVEPQALRWVCTAKVDSTPSLLRGFRDALDQMSEADVEWSPYGQLDFKGPLEASRFHGMIAFLDCCEPYMPDRCARQFGRVQKIPQPVIMPLSATRVADMRRYKVEHERSRFAWDSRAVHCMSLKAMGPPLSNGQGCSDDYFDWYAPRTRLFIHPGATGHQRVWTQSQRIHQAVALLRPWLGTSTMSEIPVDLHHSIRDAVHALTSAGTNEYPSRWTFVGGGPSDVGGEDDVDDGQDADGTDD